MEQKKKDLMSSAMSDFWASDYKIGQPKRTVPYDDSYDAIYGRGNYAPKPRIILPQRPQYQVPRRQPVPNYRPQVNQGITQAQAYKMQQLRSARARELILNAAKGVAKTGVDIGRTAVPIIKNKIQSTQAYQKYDIQREKDKIWDQYKKEKQDEVKKKEIEEYRKKIYSPQTN